MTENLGAAACAHHPDRPAERACTRCGTFVCVGCIVSGDLCTTCKSRLLREGVPWSDHEKARASARRCLGIATWTLRFSLSFGGGAVVLLAALPETLAWIAWTAGIISAVLGVLTAGVAGYGFARSRAGRPGPAIQGVFPPSVAAMMVVTGLLPVGLGVFALLRGGGG